MIVLQLFLFFATLLAGSVLLINTILLAILVVLSWVTTKWDIKNRIRAVFDTWKIIAIITGLGVLSWYVVGILKLVPIK